MVMAKTVPSRVRLDRTQISRDAATGNTFSVVYRTERPFERGLSDLILDPCTSEGVCGPLKQRQTLIGWVNELDH